MEVPLNYAQQGDLPIFGSAVKVRICDISGACSAPSTHISQTSGLGLKDNLGKEETIEVSHRFEIPENSSPQDSSRYESNAGTGLESQCS